MGQLAMLDGSISQQRISQALSGLRPFDNQTGLRLSALMDELEELASTSPLPPDFRNIPAIRAALQQRREQQKQQ
jgi:hypothetical protein